MKGFTDNSRIDTGYCYKMRKKGMVENIFEDGEWAIMEWKDSLGLRGCGFFHVKDNKIVFQRGYWDKLSFLKQHNLPIE